MPEEINIGSHVKANRDIPIKGVNKDDEGIVTNVHLIDSEVYLDIEMSDHSQVYKSCDNCWNLVNNI